MGHNVHSVSRASLSPSLRMSGRPLEKSIKPPVNPSSQAAGMSERAITERIKVLGARIGIEGLSAHDCRHFLRNRLGG